MKINLKKCAPVIAAALIAISFSPLAFAEHPEPMDKPSAEMPYNKQAQQTDNDLDDGSSIPPERRSHAAVKEQPEVVKQRLEGHKLKVCQQREKKVTNIMSRIGDRGQKHIDLFTKISERTQKFYADKGLSASNYDALVADVAAKKAAAQAAVDSTKSTVVEFKCDSDNPRGAAAHFKQSKADQNEALKAYKTSVKNLIVGVKSSKNQAGGEQ